VRGLGESKVDFFVVRGMVMAYFFQFFDAALHTLA